MFAVNEENKTVFQFGFEKTGFQDTECETQLLPLMWDAVRRVGLNLDMTPEAF